MDRFEMMTSNSEQVATLSEKVFDIAEAQSEPMVRPNGMADDFGWETVASIQ